MTPQDHSSESFRKPIKPKLSNMGRSVADAVTIKILVKELHQLGYSSKVKALLNSAHDLADKYVPEVLESELGIANDHTFGSPKTHKNYRKRLKYLVKQIKSMQAPEKEEQSPHDDICHQ